MAQPNDADSQLTGARRVTRPNEDGSVVRVTVDGEPRAGYAGEPIAAMLAAHGLMIMRTVPGSGGPRGLFCGVGRCSDCLMTVDGELNVRACVTPLREGMVIEAQQGLGVWKDVR